MVDAISLSVFRNRFESAAEGMGVTLQRAALSPNIRERLDFSCAVFDADARLIAQAAHIPVHLGSMPGSVEAAVARFAGTFAPGDVVVLNDPYQGGTHLPDITMIAPIFEGDRLLFFAASRAHHADIGGMSPGSLPLSTELYQEGLIIPPVKLARGGGVDRDLLAMITANSRAPDEREGDLRAQLAAQHVGERRLREIVAASGVDETLAHVDALIAYAQRLMTAAIMSIPEGMYRYRDALESDGQTEQAIPIQATVTLKGGLMHIDFAGTAPQVAGNLNAVPAIGRSAAWYCARLLAPAWTPVNHGTFAPITVSIPPGSLLDPRFPAAVAVGNTETGQRVVDVVLGALAKAIPDRIPASSQGTMNNLTIGGTLADGRSFVYYETIAGGHGASASGSGLSGRQSHMTNTRNTPIEALEAAFPLRILAYRLRDASGGDGTHRGGDGIERVYEFLAPAQVTINSERRTLPPPGAAGGGAGEVGMNLLIQEGEARTLPSKWTGRVQSGDQLVIRTPGGGGWGSNLTAFPVEYLVP